MILFPPNSPSRASEISRLHGQIVEMRKAKVGLQRKATEEACGFREWKQSHLREIANLRREASLSLPFCVSPCVSIRGAPHFSHEPIRPLLQAQRNQVAHTKLLAAHDRQQAVLKRRTEEVQAAQKRLREGEPARRARHFISPPRHPFLPDVAHPFSPHLRI